jgi:microcystin-dependent protein
MVALPASGAYSGAETVGDKKDWGEQLRDFAGQLLGGGPATELTIASGAVLPTGAAHTIDTEDDEASDTLTHIQLDNLPDGALLLISPASASRSVVFQHGAGGTGQILLEGATNHTLSGLRRTMLLQRRGTDVVELMRSSAGFDDAQVARLRAFADSGRGGVPVGSVSDFAGVVPPDRWYWVNGQALGRAAEPALFAALTFTRGGGAVTSGSPVVTLDDTSGLVAGLAVEIPGMLPGSTVVSVDSGTQATLSQNSTSTASGLTLRAFPYGAGDGASTFTLPDARGRVTAGRDNMGGGAGANRLTGQAGGVNGDVLGAAGGAERHQISVGEMPQHNHSYLVRNGLTNIQQGGGSFQNNVWSVDQNASTGTAGSSLPHNNVQPTLVMNKIIYAGA